MSNRASLFLKKAVSGALRWEAVAFEARKWVSVGPAYCFSLASGRPGLIWEPPGTRRSLGSRTASVLDSGLSVLT